MKQTEMNTTAMRVLLWSGVVLVAALIVAQGLIMGFIPGPSPALSAKELAQIFIERKSNILFGSLLQCICWCFYGTWAVIAFRAEMLDPAIIQIMNDWGWFDWLFTWPSFSVWMFIIAGAIFCDHNVPTLYPRWLAFFNVWCGILIFPAGLIGFFKTEPFASNGLISFWFAVFVFFGWMVVMTVTTFRMITTEDRRLSQLTGAEPERAGASIPQLAPAAR